MAEVLVNGKQWEDRTSSSTADEYETRRQATAGAGAEIVGGHSLCYVCGWSPL